MQQSSAKRSSAKTGPLHKPAIRRKSGCYTCRVRRKGCDERRDETGSCSTCIRLQLECLGYGAKRPDWLRSDGTVGAIRERIKKGLGARGMIKGRVGTGTKNQPQEGFIRLSHLGKMPAETVNYLSGSSSSGSPQRKDLVPPNQNQQFSMCESETIFTLGTDSSNSFPDICEDTFTVNSADCSGAHSACPSFGPSAPSMPAFELSPISGSSDFQDEEAEFCASDSISISSGHDIQTSDIVSRGVGLGITGVRKHDGSGQFDGMGLASIQWIPRSPRIAHEANTYVDLFQLSESLSHMSCDRGDTEISDTFLQEAAVPYIQDPFHIHSFATIPECHSWSEFDLALFSS